MRNLTLGDLKLGLKELLFAREAELQRSASGRLYEPILAQKRAAIEALPEALTGAAPLATELSASLARHDGLGGAIWQFTEAILSHPTLDISLKVAVIRIRQAFIPKLTAIRDSYTNEATAGQDHGPDLAERQDDLRLFSVPGAGTTLYSWVKAFLDEGAEIERILGDRAALSGGREAAESAAALRSSTIAVLGRFRAALADEIESGAPLPPNVDALFFGHLDELSRKRAVLEHRRAPTSTGR